MRWRALALVVLACLVGQDARAALPLWFNPLTWSLGQDGHITYGKHDFPEFLKNDDGWRHSAAHVKVFSLPGNVVWSYKDIPGLIDFLNRHHFDKMSFSDGMLFDGGQCPKGREGISHDATVHQETVKIAEMWKAAGGRLDYVIMDEPLLYGHYAIKSCSMSIQEVARRVAVTVAGIRRSFPDVQFVDAEGPSFEPLDPWLKDMQTWLAAFKAETGSPIQSVVLDLWWQPPPGVPDWRTIVRRSVATFRPLGVKTGLIIDAQPQRGAPAGEWRKSAGENAKAVAHDSMGLDYVFIDQWDEQIQRNLPENDPSSWTSVILEYVNAERENDEHNRK